MRRRVVICAVRRGAQDDLLKERLDGYSMPKAFASMLEGSANAEALSAAHTLGCLYFISPDAKALEHVRAEGHGDSDVRGIATSSNEHTANARRVITGVERVPGSPDIRFKPTGKIHRRIDGRNADVTKIAGAVARRNIQTST